MSKKILFKALNEGDWLRFQEEEVFLGSEHDLRDGYIHLSMPDQIDRVLSKYYKDRPVFLLSFYEEDLSTHLKWEPASNGDLFPHLYLKGLKKEQIVSVKEIK